MKELRDRAILVVRTMACAAKTRDNCTFDVHERCGIKNLWIYGKGSNMHFLHLHPVAAERIYVCLEQDIEYATRPGPSFRSCEAPWARPMLRTPA
nr:hypothetical protein [Pseudomonas caricapapayae]